VKLNEDCQLSQERWPLCQGTAFSHLCALL